MSPDCDVCRAIAEEMKAAFAELLARRTAPYRTVSRREMQEALKEMFASDEGWARLQEEFQASKAGKLFARLTAHRMVTGHTTFLFDALGCRALIDRGSAKCLASRSLFFLRPLLRSRHLRT